MLPARRWRLYLNTHTVPATSREVTIARKKPAINYARKMQTELTAGTDEETTCVRSLARSLTRTRSDYTSLFTNARTFFFTMFHRLCVYVYVCTRRRQCTNKDRALRRDREREKLSAFETFIIHAMLMVADISRSESHFSRSIRARVFSAASYSFSLRNRLVQDVSSSSHFRLPACTFLNQPVVELLIEKDIETSI